LSYFVIIPDFNDKIPNFQAHHQPFNYYAKFDPVTREAYRAAHLKDGDRLLADAKAGKLPAVTFYKPQGNLNQHPGYANVADGDAHVAAVIARLRKSVLPSLEDILWGKAPWRR
jgi:acid phosphatase